MWYLTRYFAATYAVESDPFQVSVDRSSLRVAELPEMEYSTRMRAVCLARTVSAANLERRPWFGPCSPRARPPRTPH
jgi:hypothetical protein